MGAERSIDLAQCLLVQSTLTDLQSNVSGKHMPSDFLDRIIHVYEALCLCLLYVVVCNIL